MNTSFLTHKEEKIMKLNFGKLKEENSMVTKLNRYKSVFRIATVCSVLFVTLGLATAHAADFRAGAISMGPSTAPPDCDRTFIVPPPTVTYTTTLCNPDGIQVFFHPPMPNNLYSVTVQPTNTGGYSPTDLCTYFNALKKTTTDFQIQHKYCRDGIPVKLDTSVTFNWIIVDYTQ